MLLVVVLYVHCTPAAALKIQIFTINTHMHGGMLPHMTYIVCTNSIIANATHFVLSLLYAQNNELFIATITQLEHAKIMKTRK